MSSRARSCLHAAGFLASLALLAVAGHWVDIAPGQPGNLLGSYGHELLLDVGIAITLAVSLNLILGMTGQFSLGHSGFLAAGACTAALLAGRYFAPQLRFWMAAPFHCSVSTSFTAIMLTGMAAGAVVAALLGLLVGLPTLRLRGDYLAIATLGFSEIVVSVMQNARWNEDFLLGGPTGLSLTSMRNEWIGNQPDTNAHLADAVQNYMDNTYYLVGFFWVFAMALVTVYIVHNIKYATAGRSLLAIREDPVASESVGVPTTRHKVAAFVIGAALAGAAGGLLAHHESLINSESFRFLSSSFTGSITLVAMVILGGQGSVTGSILAAVVLTVLPEALRSSTSLAYGYLHAWAGSPAAPDANWLERLGQTIQQLDIDKWRMVIYSVVLVVMMIFRPQGILGRYEIGDALAWLRRKVRPTPPPQPADPDRFARAEIPGEPPAAAPADTPVLDVRAVGMSFGGLRAVDDFSLTLRPRELVGLIGPNGAGKTTVFNVLTGVYRPTDGAVAFHGRSIGGLPPHRISKAGIARTFQNIRLFGRLSVLDNVMIAQHAHHRQGFAATVLRTPAFYREEALSREVALELLAIFHLEHVVTECASALSYGDQRRLEIARALATRPRLLLLDEPAAGMNPTEKRSLMDMILAIRSRFALTILLIEHDMKVVMGVCERILVLDYGKTIAQGSPVEIRKNAAVIEAYLGASAKHG